MKMCCDKEMMVSYWPWAEGAGVAECKECGRSVVVPPEALPAIKVLAVDSLTPGQNKVAISFDSSKISEDKLKVRVKNLGYTFFTCPLHAVSSVEEAMKSLKENA